MIPPAPQIGTPSAGTAVPSHHQPPHPPPTPQGQEPGTSFLPSGMGTGSVPPPLHSPWDGIKELGSPCPRDGVRVPVPPPRQG